MRSAVHPRSLLMVAISIAPAMSWGIIHLRQTHHVGQRQLTAPNLSLSPNERVEVELSSCTLPNRASKRRRKIRYVPWAGKRGMLPVQRYGVMDHEEYRHWLQMPLNPNVSVTSASTDNYFSTIRSASQSMNATQNGMKRTETPPVQPKHLKPIYVDDHIIVVNKPSGVLSVPGPRRHECVASLVYRYFGKGHTHPEGGQILDENEGNTTGWKPLTAADEKAIDTMVVHRLDRDTSGVLMFARNGDALKQLHSDFKDRRRKRVNKRYVALVCGHWNGQNDTPCGVGAVTPDEGEIDLPLVRDLERPPFMRVATAETRLQQELLKQQPQTKGNVQRHQHPGYLRMVGKGAKESLTTYRILSYEYLVDNTESEVSPRHLPVTRVELQPITGRTHQLRAHCAAAGHSIVGDSIYGYNGEGSPCGGLESDRVGASIDLQRKIYEYWTRRQKGPKGVKQKRPMMKEPRNSHKHNREAEDECMLCLHAYQLSIFHPFTEAPILFECPPPF